MMARLIIKGDSLKDDARIIKTPMPIEDEEYKKICEEATKRIKEERKNEAKAYAKAKYFVALKKKI